MSKPGEPGWVPRLVALDIDGTLLIPDLEQGMAAEVMTQAVLEAVLDTASRSSLRG